MQKVNFIVEGREYCFKKAGFSTLFHPNFISSLCDVPDLIDGLKNSTFGGHWQGIKLFLNYLVEEVPTLYNSIKFSNSPYQPIHDAYTWTTTLLAYRQWILIKRETNDRANKSLFSLNWWLSRLQSAKSIPFFDGVATYPTSKVKNRKKPSTIIDTHLPEHVLKALGAMAVEEPDEIKRIYTHTRYEISLLEVKPSGFDDLPLHEQSRWVLERRLATLREGIESQFLEAKYVRLEGLRAIRQHRHLVPLIDNLLSWRKVVGQGTKNPYADEVCALGYEMYMNALLSWLWYKNRKLPLKESISPDYYRPVKRYFSRIRKEANLSPIEFKWDDRWFADRLGCGESLIASATLMLVFDHCVNPTSAYDIENKPLSNEFGVPVLHWVKKRAKSTLFKFLPINISVSTDEVIRVVANATKVYRRYLLDEFNINDKYLFLNYHSSKEQKTALLIPRKPEWTTFAKYTKSALSKASGADWTSTANQLRNSILLLIALDDGVEGLKEEALHSDDNGSSAVSTRYADKALVQLQHNESMREFKEWLQTIITLNIEGAAEKLGVDPDDYKKRAEMTVRYRFGGLGCNDPNAGTQEGTVKGVTCNKIARCLFCPQRRNVFIETVQNLVHLLQWEEALTLGAERKEIDPKAPNWFFWMAFIKEMLRRMTEDDIASGRKQAMLAEAESIVASTPNPYLVIDFKEVV
ncbi:hypothetical protein BCS71_01940 [Vibrio lentus]|uniref:hypothetical protein n=1 Tax=Vibrio TaxID=662 RepID=UPI0002ECC129|nr:MULTISPECIES: hypothetical protein [Vibrio]OCH57289.1 hypothetical protein A6E08_18565 [Vibrio lentus]PMI59987.1 hypothetical protein BCU41_02675 [Vibrio lentus]